MNDQGLPLEGLNYSLRSSLALAWVNQQGVERVAAISRASAMDSAPSASASRETPSESQSAAVAPPAEPTPQREIERDTASLNAPETNLPDLPARESEAREFTGADGEAMYGVPNPTIDLDDALVQARKEYQALIERADESVDEMNRLLDDYDNF